MSGIEDTNDNVRIVNSDGRVDCSWHIELGDQKRIDWTISVLRDYEREEPLSGWHLQTRGTVEGWHRWRLPDGEKGNHDILSEDWLGDNLPEGWSYDCTFTPQMAFTITATDGKTLFLPCRLLKDGS